MRVADYRGCETHLRNPGLRQALYDAGGVVMRDVLLTLHGPAHQARRGLELKLFRRDYVRFYEQEIFPATMAETLAPMLAAGGADLIDLGYRMTVNLTADFAGIDRPERSVDETEALIRLVKVFSEGATMVHSTRDKAEIEGEVRAALAEFQARFVGPSVARRQALLAGGEELPRDVLAILLRNEDRLELPDDVILREMAFYLQAGAHSTANAVVHAFHEISAWAGMDATRRSRLADPRFVQRAVHESLRLHPASPESWRSDTAGNQVILDLHSANRDAAIFGPDAAQFDPDRIVPVGVLPAGLTFGMGSHACLGRELDGGATPKADADLDAHQYGIVTLLVMRLLELGAAHVAGDPPAADTRTSRPNWGRYPVRFA